MEILIVLLFIACAYIGFRLYRSLSMIMEAKRISDKMTEDRFWSSQRSFEE
jgi:hypothetical protein